MISPEGGNFKIEGENWGTHCVSNLLGFCNPFAIFGLLVTWYVKSLQEFLLPHKKKWYQTVITFHLWANFDENSIRSNKKKTGIQWPLWFVKMKMIFRLSLVVTRKNGFSTTCHLQSHVLVSVTTNRFCRARQIKNFGANDQVVKNWNGPWRMILETGNNESGFEGFITSKMMFRDLMY